MHAEVNVRFELRIEEDKTIPVAALAESVTELNVESTILEELVYSLSESQVEAYCGPKHARGTGDRRFRRAGTSTRTAVTTAGEHEFTLHYIEDTEAGEHEQSYRRPVEELLTFDGKRIYQEDISLAATELATTLSYRDAVDHGSSFSEMPARSTVHQRTVEHGTALGEFLEEETTDEAADVVIADGTKCHSQQAEDSLHSVNITLGAHAAQRTDQQDDHEFDPALLDINVDDTWEQTATRLQQREAITDDATVVSDSEEPLVQAFTTDDRCHQLDLCHVGRTLKHKLWEDDVFELAERKTIAWEALDELFHLKNSVALHAPNDEYQQIRDRIDQTTENLTKLAWQLEQFGSSNAATYLRKWSANAMTFADHALKDTIVPWTSNIVERAMGEVAKRCKHQWMRWTEHGLESVLCLRLVRYVSMEVYESFTDKLVGRSTTTAITMEVSVQATRGEL